MTGWMGPHTKKSKCASAHKIKHHYEIAKAIYPILLLVI